MLENLLQFNNLLSDYQSNIKKIWDLRANEIYIRWRDEEGDFKTIEKSLNLIKPLSLLDIGYGYGRLAPLYKNISCVVGMDISQNMLELARKHKQDNEKIKTLLGDIRRMPFTDGIFSCLVSVRTLNHIHPDDLSSVEHEISRVCRDAVIILESDVKLPGVGYEFEHNYDRFLQNTFTQSKIKLEENVYLRLYFRNERK